jgi:flagellar hook-associated protein 3 FlgL
MRTASISTMSLVNTPRSSVARMQADLVKLNQEVVTGRMADVGLALGAQTGQSVTLHVDKQALGALIDSNALLAGRLQQTQSALDTMRSGADNFLQDLIAAQNSLDANTLPQGARAALASFIGAANASDGHGYLFGGINTANAPIAAYDSGPGAAVDAAFLAKFGFAQDDPAAAGIDGAAMSDFLDNEFAAIFADPAWGATWSSAADQTTTNRISPTSKISASVSANEPAMRKLAEVYSMVGCLGMDGLGKDARQAIIDKAAGLLGSATDGITGLQADVGAMQNQVNDASQRLQAQQTILDTQIGALEGVDPAEAKVHIDTLSTQIEMSYSLTTKLLQMSLLNYV